MESDATKLNVVSSNNVESHMVAVHSANVFSASSILHLMKTWLII